MPSGPARHCPPPEYALPCFRSQHSYPTHKSATSSIGYRSAKGWHPPSFAPHLHHTTNACRAHQANVQFMPYTNV
jgi:hypothetical protein